MDTLARRRPHDRERTESHRERLALVREACARLDAEQETPLTLYALADGLGVSPWRLHRLFKDAMGLSPRAYAEAKRQARLRAELKTGDGVAAATYGAGYGSSSRVYERARQELGMTPASYARGGQGARISYAIGDSPLGRLLVAATGHGVCFVALGEDDSELKRRLADEFPKADEVQEDVDAIVPALSEILDHLRGAAPHPELPLDVRATAFQRRVWQELAAIPIGETRSYAEIARRLGLPKGQRAVGQACASNPVALLVPCHRALRSDGGLGGYRWGRNRKAELLRCEAESARMRAEDGDNDG
jgi:AraC family transcriptional regulator of adaptative response/methylated-DNA-[protein]-cysteine methyltransferase